MTDDAYQRAKKAGYAQGYAAGVKRAKRIITEAAHSQASLQFWQANFLAVTPVFSSCDGLNIGGAPVTKIKDRVTVAAEWADLAMKAYKARQG